MTIAIFSFVQFIILIISPISAKDCKYSKEGTEYIGITSYSSIGNTCQFWSKIPNKAETSHLDLQFADGSKVQAKNYCRNPTRDSKGPWCYVQKGEVLLKETCNISICSVHDCKVTGPGLEYAGSLRKSQFLLDCLPWTETNFFALMPTNYFCLENDGKYPNDIPPHEFTYLFYKGKSTKLRQKKSPKSNSFETMDCRACRNPDETNGGPWCIVDDGFGTLIKNFCDVPFCDITGPVLYSTSPISAKFDNFVFFNTQSISGRLRLWRPVAWLESRLVIFVSVLDSAVTMNEVKKWGSAVAVSLGNAGSALVSDKVYDTTTTPALLTADSWTYFNITWSRTIHGTIIFSLYLNKEAKAKLVAEIDVNGKLLNSAEFHYLSLIGEDVLLDLFTNEEDCYILTTSVRNSSTWWKLARTLGEIYFDFKVRLTLSATLILSRVPNENDQLQIELHTNGSIYLKYETQEKGIRQIAQGEMLPFKHWQWEHLILKISTNSLIIQHRTDFTSEVVLEISNSPLMSKLMWISPISVGVGHWAFFCSDEVDIFKKVEPPECASSTLAADYNGTQNYAASGEHCLPWTDNRLPSMYKEEELFDRFGGRLATVNYCRNIEVEATGPCCFVNSENDGLVSKHACYVPSCTLEDCRNSGTGTDYIGNIAKSRSGRMCIPLNGDQGGGQMRFCSNLKKNIGGPYCNTTDPSVPVDYCQIKDCERPLEATVLSRLTNNASIFYILPEWKIQGLKFWIKFWNPEREGTVLMKLRPVFGTLHYKLVMNNPEGEKLQLFIADDSTGFEKLLHEITISHLIQSGIWRGLWLKCEEGLIELGHQTVPHAFFRWKSYSSDAYQLKPVFIDFTTLDDSWIGVNFQLKECLIERVYGLKDNRIWPLELWRPSKILGKVHLNLYVSGDDSFIIYLFGDPESTDHFALLIEGKIVSWTRQIENRTTRLKYTQFETSVLSPEKWRNLLIRRSELSLVLDIDGQEVLSYQRENQPLIIYWFSVGVEKGLALWSANCQPLDVGREPRDGGWSKWGPWKCDAVCGGGEGRKERNCTDPAPNVLGALCSGPAVYEGTCNNFPCGDISPDLKKRIRRRLSQRQVALSAKTEEKVLLECNNDLADALEGMVKNIHFLWTHNGSPINSSRYYKLENSYSIEIQNATLQDTGVYICTAEWLLNDLNKSMVVGVATLVVLSTASTVQARASSRLPLQCKGVELAYIFADLSQRWEHDGIVWKDYGPTTLDAVDIDYIDFVDNKHEGTWICVISQESLGFSWTTNWFRLHVKSAPNFWSNLIEDQATSFIFGGLSDKMAAFVFILIILIIAGVIIATSVAIIYL